jgi:hypothetical protein
LPANQDFNKEDVPIALRVQRLNIIFHSAWQNAS